MVLVDKGVHEEIPKRKKYAYNRIINKDPENYFDQLEKGNTSIISGL